MNKQRGYSSHELIVVLVGLLWLAGVITIISIAWHFISKFW